MIHLINKNDKDVISTAGFVKNAVFYKDMLAFYDSYYKLMSEKPSSLPSYCYKKGNYYLEGICLLFKDYASELGFESIRLTLEYLKVLYYTIASYSKDGEFPEKEVLLQEFEVYKSASYELATAASSDLKEKKEVFDKAKEEHDKVTTAYAKKLIFSRLFDGFFVFMLVFTVLASMLQFTFYYLDKFTFVEASIAAAVTFVVSSALTIMFKVLSRRKQSQANDINYTIQGKKKVKDTAELDFARSSEKYNKITSEKYEYNSSFVGELKKCAETIDFKEIIAKAKEYKMLSYNMKLDLTNLFDSQEEEIIDIISKINSISNPETSEKDFESIYKEISEKEWLYYNNEVRFEFIKRMADVSEFTFNYQVNFEGKKVDPFGISVKKLSKEPIVYLRSESDLFISASLDKFLNTRYIKSTKTLELKGLKSSDALKKVKMEFANHFFDYEGTIKYNNLFYETKLQDGVKIPREIIENNRKVPTFVYMKLKLIENRLGLSNCDAGTIKQIASLIDKFEETGNFEKIAVLDMSEDDESVELSSETAIYEDLGYAVKYTFADGSYIGYRLANFS